MTKSPTILRRALATLLAACFALQPIGVAWPKCAIGGWMTGRGPCCCAEPESSPNPARNCCSVAQDTARTDGVSVAASAKRCTCEVNAPAPPTALPRCTGARGEDGSTLALFRWIDRGAEISAATPVLSTASPPGEPGDLGAAPPGLRPLVSGSAAPGFAGGPRGLLAVTCVARC